MAHGEGSGKPLQYSCLENPMDSKAWWAAAYGVAQSWAWLKQLCMHACMHALEKEMAIHSVFLPKEFHGRSSLVSYSPRGLRESNTTEWLHFNFSLWINISRNVTNVYLTKNGIFFASVYEDSVQHFPSSRWKQLLLECSPVWLLTGRKQIKKNIANYVNYIS